MPDETNRENKGKSKALVAFLDDNLCNSRNKDLSVCFANQSLRINGECLHFVALLHYNLIRFKSTWSEN